MIVGFVVAAADDGPNTALLIPILLGLAAMLVSPLPFRSVSLPRLAQAEVTADGSAVHVSDVSLEFAAQLSGPPSE